MNRVAIIIFVSTLFMFSCNSTEKETEKAVDKNQYFGEKIDEEGAISANELITKIQGKDSLTIKIAGTIDEVCQKKGCWMDVQIDDENYLNVKFKDYEFFVPKDAAGKTTIIEGVAYLDTTSVEELRHYASDAGEPDSVIQAITEPEIGYSFMAKGVIIKE